MFNKKRIVIFLLFLILMFLLITFGNKPILEKHLVTFIDGFNDTTISEEWVELGKDAKVPENPKHTGYVFAGWFLKSDKTVEVKSFNNIKKDITVVALYEDDRNGNGIPDSKDLKYTVTFRDTISNEVLKTEKVLIGMDAKAPNAPKHKGYTFVGWSRDYTNVTANIIVDTAYIKTASSDKIPAKYTVTFVDGDTNEVIKTQEVLKGLSATAPTAPEHADRVFVKWNGEYTNVTSNRTVTAIYANDLNNNGIDDELDPKYKVEFKALENGTLEGATIYENVLVGLNFNKAGIIAPNPKPNTNYVFDKWSGEFSDDTVVSENLLYEASFVKDPNKKLNVDTSDVTDEAIVYDEIDEEEIKNQVKVDDEYVDVNPKVEVEIPEDCTAKADTTCTVKVIVTDDLDNKVETEIEIEIKKRPVTVTIDDKTSVYQSDIQELTSNADEMAYKGNSIGVTLSTTATKDSNVGTYPITGEWSNKNYDVTFIDGVYTITKKHLDKEDIINDFDLEYNGDGEATYDGEEHKSVIDDGKLPDGIKVEGDREVGGTDADEYSGKVEVTCSGNYECDAFEIETSVTVNKKGIKVTTESKEKVYDGTALKAPGKVEGIIEGETYTFKTTGEQINVGTSDNTYKLTFDGTAKSSNYNISEEKLGKLTVTAKSITETVEDPDCEGESCEDKEVLAKDFTVTKPSDVVYNGLSQEKKPTVIDVNTTLVEGRDYTLSYSANTTHVGEVTVTITGTGNYTGSYNVTYKITPAALTVVTNNNTKVYDKLPLTAPGSISGFVNGENATFTVVGTQTEVGTSNNTYVLLFNGSAIEADYTIDETIGKLTVTRPTDKVVVTITGDKDTVTYDGNEHSISGYDISVSNSAYSAADFTFNGTDSVTKTDVGEYPMGLKASDFVNTNNNFNEVEFSINDGLLKINPRSLNTTDEDGNSEITVSPLADVTYNGENQKQEPTVKDGETLLVKGTDYELTYSNDTKNVGKVTVTITAKGNYTGTYELTYNITERPVTVSTPNASKVYDGTALTREGTVTGIVDEYTFETTGTITNVGTSENSYSLVFKDESKRDNYEITEDLGTLGITRKAITVTADDTEKVFNTQDPTLTATVDELVGEDIITYTVSRAAGENVGTYTITPTGAAEQGNYTVTYVNGTFTITPVTDEVIVTIEGNTLVIKHRDGQEHTVNGYSVNIPNDLLSENDISLKENAKASATRSETGKTFMGLTSESFVNNNANFTNVKFVVTDGYVQIDPAYTITWVDEDGTTVLEIDTDVLEGETPTFNGTIPTKARTDEYTYTFNGWTPSVTSVNENATYKATYTATKNKYTVTWKNYDGTVLETDSNVEYGTMPEYNGNTPTKERTQQYTYTYAGWDKEVSAVTGNVTYTATFNKTVNKYTVKFYALTSESTSATDLKLISTQKVEYGSAAKEPTVSDEIKISNKLYYFAAWQEDYANITDNIDVHAKYSDAEIKETGLYSLKDSEAMPTTMPYSAAYTPQNNWAPYEPVGSIKIRVKNYQELENDIQGLENNTNWCRNNSDKCATTGSGDKELIVAYTWSEVKKYLTDATIAELDKYNTNAYKYNWYVLKYCLSDHAFHLDGIKVYNGKEVQSITLNQKDNSILKVGNTMSVTATITPSNSRIKDVVWSTSDSSIATISGSGNTVTIRGIKAGKVTITVKSLDGEHIAELHLQVTA